MGNAFHQATVAQEHISIVVNNREAFTVEFFRQQILSQSHAHCIGDALTQWACGGFHAIGIAVFRVAWGFAVPLTEVFQIFNRQIVASQMQQRVNQHRSVAVGQHETVAIHKVWIGWIVAQELVPQHFGHVGHAHGRTWVT